MGLAKDIVKENKKILLLTLALFVVSIIGVFLLNQNFLNSNPTIIERTTYSKPENVLEKGVDYKAVIKTEYGDINIDLLEQEAPNAVNSFIFLVGENFYDGLSFHRVIEDFVIQAGDNLGNGEGDPGYDLEVDKNQLEVDEYTVCMVNGSQFFIVLRGANIDDIEQYPVVGEVTSGFAVVDAIEKVNVDKNYKPLNDVTISSILIIE